MRRANNAQDTIHSPREQVAIVRIDGYPTGTAFGQRATGFEARGFKARGQCFFVFWPAALEAVVAYVAEHSESFVIGRAAQ